jgi:hypothetical protein
MRKPNSPTVWLSADMARALAAACPPLTNEDVVDAADELAADISTARVALHLIQHGTDLQAAQRVVEALGALHHFASRRPDLLFP